MSDMVERLDALHIRLEDRENTSFVDISVCVDAQIEIENLRDHIAQPAPTEYQYGK